jgi:hypothetical protein
LVPVCSGLTASLRFTALAQALPLAPSIAAVAAVFRDCFAETFGYREVTTVGL